MTTGGEAIELGPNELKGLVGHAAVVIEEVASNQKQIDLIRQSPR